MWWLFYCGYGLTGAEVNRHEVDFSIGIGAVVPGLKTRRCDRLELGVGAGSVLGWSGVIFVPVLHSTACWSN